MMNAQITMLQIFVFFSPRKKLPERAAIEINAIGGMKDKVLVGKRERNDRPENKPEKQNDLFTDLNCLFRDVIY